MCPETGWRWLQKLGFRLAVPAPGTRRRPPRTSSGGGFDGLATFLADLRQSDPTRPVELWCEDEARLGLKPVARRVWALTGTRPTRCGRQRFESLSVYGFAGPATGPRGCPFLPPANAECMGEALADFARGGPNGARRRPWWCW